MKKETVLVIGASGTVGAGVVKHLEDAGHLVKAATSKTLDLTTGEGLVSAFDGADRAFFLSPLGHADQHRMLSPLIQEAKRRGLQKVVLMTAMGANAVESSPFRRAEIELERSGLDYAILRPNWFLQNFNTFWRQGIAEHGKILVPGGRAAVSFIDARDISEVAAAVLLGDRFSRVALDLTGPRAVTHDEVAAALCAATGRKIDYQEIEPAVLRQGLVAAGVDGDYADFMLAIFGFLREGYNARVTKSVAEVLGREARSLEDYARDFRDAWI